jgi:hypothetical protein
MPVEKNLFMANCIPIFWIIFRRDFGCSTLLLNFFLTQNGRIQGRVGCLTKWQFSFTAFPWFVRWSPVSRQLYWNYGKSAEDWKCSMNNKKIWEKINFW